MSIRSTLNGSSFSIACIWTSRKNSSSASRFGSPVSVSVLARSSDLCKEFADRIELARFLDEIRLQFGGSRRGPRQFADQVLDQEFRIDAALGPLCDIADRPHMRAIIGNRRRQILFWWSPSRHGAAVTPDGPRLRRRPAIRYRS